MRARVRRAVLALGHEHVVSVLPFEKPKDAPQIDAKPEPKQEPYFTSKPISIEEAKKLAV